MILSTVILLPKSIKLDDYFFILARKRAIAAIMSSVERGFLVALVEVAVVAVLFKPVVKPLVERTVELAFKVFALALLFVVVVVVVVVVVLTTLGLYIEVNELGRAAVLLVLVVAVAVRLAKVELVVALGRLVKVELEIVLGRLAKVELVRLALVNELALALRVAVLGRDAAKVGFNSGIVSETGLVTIPGSRGAS